MGFVVEDDKCFRIEKSPSIVKLNNVKTSEFISITAKDEITIIEAKTSIPNAQNPASQEKLNEFVKEIREKFQNSISIINAAIIGRLSKTYKELPMRFMDIEYNTVEYVLFLVVKQAREEWLPFMSDLLLKELRPFLTCWNIPTKRFKVINESMAKDNNLIL